MVVIFDCLLEGWLLINVVIGGDLVENKGDGIFFSYSECYQVICEFFDVYICLLCGEKVDYYGEYIYVEGVEVLFLLVQENGLLFYFGGFFDVVIDVVVEQIDSYLMWGEFLELVVEKLVVVCECVVVCGCILQYGICLYVIVCEMEEEVWVVVDWLIVYFDDDIIVQV